MLKSLKKSNSEGFTIIEVMIVLAIAGLILLIVFLAVPALQRSGRNTQRKNDVGALTTGVNGFVTNNNGTLPTTVTVAASGQTTISGAAGTSSLNDVKLGYYQAGSVKVVAFAAAPGYGVAPNTFFGLFPVASAAAAPATVGPDTAYIVTGATCNGNAVAAGSARSFAIMYELEQSGSTAGAGGVHQCTAS